jgi:hypothetical protein
VAFKLDSRPKLVFRGCRPESAEVATLSLNPREHVQDFISTYSDTHVHSIAIKTNEGNTIAIRGTAGDGPTNNS